MNQFCLKFTALINGILDGVISGFLFPFFSLSLFALLLVFLQIAQLLLLALSGGVKGIRGESDWQCKYSTGFSSTVRPHSVSILEFGAKGDGKTVNTLAFQNAIFYLRSFADKGGAQLYVPPGRWLTGSFNLTSHLTLFLERDAIILASQVFTLYISLFSFYWYDCMQIFFEEKCFQYSVELSVLHVDLHLLIKTFCMMGPIV